MSHAQLVEYIDEKARFLAVEKETFFEVGHTKDKEKEYRDNYIKSFIHRSEFESKTLKKFKVKVKELNSNYKVVKQKPQSVIKEEKLRHQQNKTASEKRGMPKFDLEMAKRLLEGKFYDMDEEDEGAVTV
jgi:hypothetical protein